MLEAGVSSRANDVYAWGVLLWSMLAGSRPWAGMSHTAVVHAVCGQRRQLVFPPDTPEALLMLGQACLSYDAAERPSFQVRLRLQSVCACEVPASPQCVTAAMSAPPCAAQRDHACWPVAHPLTSCWLPPTPHLVRHTLHTTGHPGGAAAAA
jgi:hypothetical protein